MRRDFGNYTKENRNFGPSGVDAHDVGRALADVVATKLGIILSFFLSFFFLPRTFFLEGVCLGS